MGGQYEGTFIVSTTCPIFRSAVNIISHKRTVHLSHGFRQTMCYIIINYWLSETLQKRFDNNERCPNG